MALPEQHSLANGNLFWCFFVMVVASLEKFSRTAKFLLKLRVIFELF
jgi:hypothetical protein